MKVLQPTSDRIVIKEPDQATNAAGIDLARSSRERPTLGIVIAVGPEVKEIKVGDEVAFTRFGPNEVEVDKTTYYVLEEKQVLTKIVEQTEKGTK